MNPLSPTFRPLGSIPGEQPWQTIPQDPNRKGPVVVLMPKARKVPVTVLFHDNKPLHERTTAAGIAVISHEDHQNLQELVRALNGRVTEFERLLDREVGLSKQNAEITFIKQDPKLNTYYQYVSRLLTGSWLACQTVSSGIAAGNGDEEQMASQLLSTIGTLFPIIQPATGVLNLLISGWSAKQKKIFVQNVSSYFPTVQSAFNDIENLARKLTFRRKELIQNLNDPTGLANTYNQGKAWVSGDDKYDSAITIQANEDCHNILTALQYGKSQMPTLEDVINSATDQKPQLAKNHHTSCCTIV